MKFDPSLSQHNHFSGDMDRIIKRLPGIEDLLEHDYGFKLLEIRGWAGTYHYQLVLTVSMPMRIPLTPGAAEAASSPGRYYSRIAINMVGGLLNDAAEDIIARLGTLRPYLAITPGSYIDGDKTSILLNLEETS